MRALPTITSDANDYGANDRAEGETAESFMILFFLLLGLENTISALRH
jgi:hypothetical protein